MKKFLIIFLFVFFSQVSTAFAVDKTIFFLKRIDTPSNLDYTVDAYCVVVNNFSQWKILLVTQSKVGVAQTLLDIPFLELECETKLNKNRR